MASYEKDVHIQNVTFGDVIQYSGHIARQAIHKDKQFVSQSC